MSVHIIYYKDGAKLMRPVKDEMEYRLLRDSERNRGAEKRMMVQMNYSCLPNADGGLKGAERVSRSVGMDIDFDPSSPDYEERMRSVPELVMGRKEELGLLMLERSANKGYHVVFRRREGMTQEENLRWASELLGVEYDKGAKDITRVFFTPPTDRLLFVDKELFDNREATLKKEITDSAEAARNEGITVSAYSAEAAPTVAAENKELTEASDCYLGIPYAEIVRKWWAMYNDSQEPVKSNRNTLTFELAVNLRHICGFDRGLLDRIIPCYDGFPEAEPSEADGIDEALAKDDLFYYEALPRMPQGVKDSIDAVGPALALPVLTAVCPVIGMLATGVRVDVHGKMNSLNLISYIAGDFASGKGGIDPVVEAWTAEVKAMDRMYQQQEDEWRAKKRAAKNKKEQPEEPKLPVRCLTLNNTVANLAERLANTGGRHAFSFTPEADTVAQKWRSAMSDFSVMLRQAYDGTCYEREARSADAVNVHIDRLLWNVVMCGTPDALYRVVTNYTDGFQSRIALARTPDNTFQPLTENLHVLTDKQRERIRQIAHLLPLMAGEVVLPKLEARGRQWLERVRLETMKDDDKVKARQRFRICPTTMRMMTCLMLCRVAGQLIDRHGVAGAETRLKQQPGLWKEMIVKQQQPSFLAAFDVLADYQIENALHFFRERIEAAFSSKDYCGQAASERTKRGKNDSIFERLDTTFSFEQALQHSIAVKGCNTSRNAVHQMLKNWRKQGLVTECQNHRYRKN